MGGSEKRVCSDKDCDVRRNRMHSFSGRVKKSKSQICNFVSVTAFPQIFVSFLSESERGFSLARVVWGNSDDMWECEQRQENRVSALASTRVSSLSPSQSFMSFGALAHDTTKSFYMSVTGMGIARETFIVHQNATWTNVPQWSVLHATTRE